MVIKLSLIGVVVVVVVEERDDEGVVVSIINLSFYCDKPQYFIVVAEEK